MDIAVLGLDLGKNSCSVVGLDRTGKVVLRWRMQRKTIVVLAAKLPPCIVAMEACCGRIISDGSSRPRDTQSGSCRQSMCGPT
jgi:hypothetical protein